MHARVAVKEIAEQHSRSTRGGILLRNVPFLASAVEAAAECVLVRVRVGDRDVACRAVPVQATRSLSVVSVTLSLGGR